MVGSRKDARRSVANERSTLQTVKQLLTGAMVADAMITGVLARWQMAQVVVWCAESLSAQCAL